MRLAIVGTGHVGLVVGTGFAENGHRVVCVDIDAERIARLQKEELPLYEPGLEELVVRNMEEGRLAFSTDLAGAVKDSEVVFLCVGAGDGSGSAAEVALIEDVAREVAGHMNSYKVIVNKSTCPVGTAERLEAVVRSQTSHDVDIVVNPEFLREGNAVDDFMRPDRVVVGCGDVRVSVIMKELYSPFLRTGKPFLVMSPRSAEMAKYAMNVLLATRIAVMNELANLAEVNGADITEVRDALMSDSRIGPTYLFPGLGYGGSCLVKDVVACAEAAESLGVECGIIAATDATNRRHRQRFIDKILGFYGDAIAEKRVAVWGFTFKSRTDDSRNAPAIDIIDALLQCGAAVTVYDPVAGRAIRERYGDAVQVAGRGFEALRDADGLVIATEWNEFRRPDFEAVAAAMREPVVFDGRNLYTPETMARYGIRYFSVGRGDS